jgi:multisubunit Na+/H+ antiporter MnhC subunit
MDQPKIAQTKIAQPKIVDELRKMEYEPLLPIEKKLIVWSIVIGVSLAALLAWIGHIFLS